MTWVCCLFENRLLEITKDLSIDDRQEFVTRLKSYWTLKRRSRNGVPLLRRLQTSHMSRHKDQVNKSFIPKLLIFYLFAYYGLGRFLIVIDIWHKLVSIVVL